MSSLLPFIFARITLESQEADSLVIRDWVVMIANHDVTQSDVSWMNDPELGQIAYTPTVDICTEEHVFPDYQSARNFVKNWWASQ